MMKEFLPRIGIHECIPDVVQTIYHLDQVYDSKLVLRIQKMDVLFDRDRYIYKRVQSCTKGWESRVKENPASKYAFCNNQFLRAIHDKL